MTTQFERDMLAREQRTRQLSDLVEAATAALSAIEDPDLARDLQEALKPYDLKNLRSSIEYYNREKARREEDERRAAEGARFFEELPDAPPRMQCHTQVARDMGRWTDFGRCEKPATRVVLDRANRRERVCCTIHAKEWAQKGGEVDPYWWYDHPSHLIRDEGTAYQKGNPVETHRSWYRMQGWCMAKRVSDGAYCKVRVDKGSGKHEGKEHRFA